MARRLNGEGTINMRKDGRWQSVYIFEGKRYYIYGKSKSDVCEKLKIKQKELDLASSKGIKNYVEQSQINFGEWLDLWLEKYVKGITSPSTYTGYEQYIRIHIKPSLGTLKIKELNSGIFQSFFKSKFRPDENYKPKGSLSDKSILNMKNMIHSTLEQAKIDGIILHDPLIGVKLPKMRKPDIRALTLEEQGRLIETSRKWYPNWPSSFSVVLAVFTGMRKGEILGLRWQDVDLESEVPTINVRHSLKRNKDIYGVTENKTILALRDTKTSNSRRTIPLFEGIRKQFEMYKQDQIAAKQQRGLKHQESDFVFQNSIFKMYDPERFYDKYLKLLKEAEITNADFHTLRHTFATRSLEQGMDIKVLSSILGHANASTTLNLYAHALPDHKKLSMEKLADLFQKAS